MLTFSCLKCLNNCTLDKGFSAFVYVCELSGVCLYVWVAAYVSVSEWYCPSPLSPVWVGSLVWSLCSPQSSQPCQPSWTWSTSNGIAFKSISVLCWWAHLLSQISPWATSLFISNSSVFSPCTRAVMHTHTQCERTHAHTRRTHTAHQHINLCLPSTVLLFLWYTMSSWFSYKKIIIFFSLCFSFYLFLRSVQSQNIPEEWLVSCLYFQNADYCRDPTGLVFFSKHSGDVSPKVAPWCRDPWPSVGDPTRCGVCAGTVARGSSVSRGEALSPQTATESMARGVLSAPLSIILPPCLSFSFSTTFPLSHSLFHTVSFLHCLSLYPILCISLFYSLLLFFLSLFLLALSDILFAT